MTEPLSNWASAEKEKWKAVQKVVPLGNRLGNFIGSIIGPPASALGDMLGDSMRSWRAANLDRIAQKWAAKMRKRKIHSDVIKILPFREAILLVDEASKEDDDDVQELWACLIANATDVDAGVEIKKMHIDLLKQINALEACVLKTIFSWHDSRNYTDRANQRRWKSCMKRWPELTSEQLRVCMQNLQRLGLVTPNITEFEILNYHTIEKWQETVNNENIVVEFKKIIENLILELTNFSGNPMNDMLIPESPREHYEFVKCFSLTRIGWDLYLATTGNPEMRAAFR